MDFLSVCLSGRKLNSIFVKIQFSKEITFAIFAGSRWKELIGNVLCAQAGVTSPSGFSFHLKSNFTDKTCNLNVLLALDKL